jgi:hypothetical protein
MDGKHGLYGYLSGFTTAAALQPLENVKMVLMLPPKDAVLGSNFINNISKATTYLYRDAGMRAFYRGTVPNVFKSAFSSSIYFTVLRLCENFHQQFHFNNMAMATSFLSSMVARIASAMAANPFSIIETRFEYAGQ